jgi:hypothetical protein
MPAATASPHRSLHFSHLHIDLVGPLQYSGGFNFIFTVIDCISKWIEAIPLFDMSAAACAKALVFWISHFGVPEMITSDRGPEFTSNIWSQLRERLQISYRPATAYHPESNGAVERLHRCLKDALHARAAAVTSELPFVILSLLAQPREDTGLSLVEVVFGTPIVLPTNFCKATNFLLIQLSKNLKKPWMLPLFLCLGTIPVPSCPAARRAAARPLHLVVPR